MSSTGLRAGGVVLCALLLAHAAFYGFLCDDAFISFRYARNLVEGHGLVFNPGDPPVEGYTNLLWVLLLALGNALGVDSEIGAPVLSLVASAALLARVAAFAERERLPGEPWPLCLAAPLLLAATRSFAVWSTSGLETRLFELLVVCAVLELRAEVGAAAPRARSALPLSSLLFAAACWTRPDGILIAGCCYAVALALGSGRERRRETSLSLQLWLAGVGLQLGFRLLYYGDFVPNTFHAKVGGRLWPEMGLAYAEAFALEYALWLWLPAALLGALWRLRRGDRLVPALFAAALLPHAAYVIAIGGDHFEYRPFDLCFPFLYLLAADALRALVALGNRARLSALALFGLGLCLLVELPYRSHLGFPERYRPGFPGARAFAPPSGYLVPSDAWLYSLPLLRGLAARHRERLFELTGHFVGLRAEEHRLFAETAHREGHALARLVSAGLLPRDTHIATDAVGAIPYDSRLRTLDRLGLTDAVVARSDFVRPELLGHGKSASLDYARAIGVDLWAIHPVHLLWLPRDPGLPDLLVPWREQGLELHFAGVGHGLFLIAHLPQGVERARERFPRLDWRSVFDPAAAAELLAD